jgi:phosphate transport system permease protein
VNIFKGKKSKIIESFIKILGILPMVITVFIIGHIFIRGISAITWEFLTQVPRNGMREGGILPAIIGSMYLTLGTIIIIIPIGIFTAIYLVEYSEDTWFRRTINLIILNLAGIPSVVYGLFGMAFFVIFLGMGSSLISGILTLGIMRLPVIITTTREALLSVPNDLREASLALGATKWETTCKVVLPAATPGIITGIILSISRLVGETAPILGTAATSYLPYIPETIWDQTMSLPYHLYVIMTQVPNMPKVNIEGTLFVLTTLSVGFNLLGFFVRNKFKERY